jgi:hypothetical protein
VSVNPGARGNEVSPLPGQMALGIVNVIQAWQITEIYDMSWKHLPVTASFVVRWCSTAELTPLCSMFFRKVVEGKEDAIWKVKSDFRHLSIRKHFTFNLVFHFFELR